MGLHYSSLRWAHWISHEVSFVHSYFSSGMQILHIAASYQPLATTFIKFNDTFRAWNKHELKSKSLPTTRKHLPTTSPSLPTTYRPALPTTYRPRTDHIPTTYRPHTGHVLTAFTDHVPTMYRPHTDRLYRPRTDYMLTDQLVHNRPLHVIFWRADSVIKPASSVISTQLIDLFLFLCS